MHYGTLGTRHNASLYNEFPNVTTNSGKPNQVPSNISLYREDSVSRDKEFILENLPGTVRNFGVVRYLVGYIGSGTARGKKISVSEISLFDWCMMFLQCCVTTCVHISTCVVNF